MKTKPKSAKPKGKPAPAPAVKGKNALLGAEIFKDLDAETMESLASKVSQEQYAAGQVLMEIDSKPDKVFFIEKGKVKISRITRFGDETVLNILEEGNVVGELSVVDGNRRSAQAV